MKIKGMYLYGKIKKVILVYTIRIILRLEKKVYIVLRVRIEKLSRYNNFQVLWFGFLCSNIGKSWGNIMFLLREFWYRNLRKKYIYIFFFFYLKIYRFFSELKY